MQIFQGSVLYEPEHILKFSNLHYFTFNWKLSIFFYFSKIFCDFPKDPNLMK